MQCTYFLTVKRYRYGQKIMEILPIKSNQNPTKMHESALRVIDIITKRDRLACTVFKTACAKEKILPGPLKKSRSTGNSCINIVVELNYMRPITPESTTYAVTPAYYNIHVKKVFLPKERYRGVF